ncbi:MAG: hypothetical protein AAB515_02370 [Patescibacteria group bacterium]
MPLWTIDLMSIRKSLFAFIAPNKTDVGGDVDVIAKFASQQ